MVVSIYKGQCEILVEEGWYSSAITGGFQTVVNRRRSESRYYFLSKLQATFN